MAIKMNKYIALNVLLLSLNLRLGVSLKFNKPLAKTLWEQPCKGKSMILNECNWCRCVNGQYKCDARICSEVDMFGHFNDAIQDINVGMKGHGTWRSGESACIPGVSYHRSELLCICTGDGNWPNPVCRDTFRILHEVEKVTDAKNFKDQHCIPAKLYLVGCNVCFCPADEVPNPSFCTKQTCAEDDPIFGTPKGSTEVSEIYSECEVDNKYMLGCRTCHCIKNNRLVCDNCTSTPTHTKSHCSNRKPGEKFNLDCNTCRCDENGLMYCSVKKCLQSNVISQYDVVESNFESVDSPHNDIECVEGTKYKKVCNTCYCYTKNDTKRFACTLEKCSASDSSDDCVEGSIYNSKCLICKCSVSNGIKMQICQEDPKCKEEKKWRDLDDMEGYCEPMHLYFKDCNSCKCLPDGETVLCTAVHCQNIAATSKTNKPKLKAVKDELPKQDPISVKIVPVVKDIGYCTKGSRFKIDCNICFCLSNGDVLCTTEDCNKYNL